MCGQRSGHSLCKGDHWTRGTEPCILLDPCPGPFDREQQWLGAAACLLTACRFLFLPPGIISEQGLREEVPPILQHHILKVALELPASKFLWLKAQVGRCGLHPLSLASRRACWLSGLGAANWKSRTLTGLGAQRKMVRLSS